MIDYRFQCQECGKRFRTVAAAQRAANDGCPKCGGVDIDIDPNPPQQPRRMPSGLLRDTSMEDR